MNESSLIFGAALDYSSREEHVASKIKYLESLRGGQGALALSRDPFDVIAPHLANLCNGIAKMGGKVDVPGWLRPCPALDDAERVGAKAFAALDREAILAEYAGRCREMALREAPLVPVMIGVDHALAAGVIQAAAKRHGPGGLAVLVLDSHFDALPPEVRARDWSADGADDGLAGISFDDGPDEDTDPAVDSIVFEAGDVDLEFGSDLELVEQPSDLSWSAEGPGGDWLARLMEAGHVLPGNLFVAGVSDYPSEAIGDTEYGQTYLDLEMDGVTIYTKRKAYAPDFGRRLGRDLARTKARYLYVSVDADVGAGASLNAARFGDAAGLAEDHFMNIAHGVRDLIERERFALAGLDISEVWVHRLGSSEGSNYADRTAELCAGFAARVIGNVYMP